MSWLEGDVSLFASRGDTVGPAGEFFTSSVSDTALLDLKRSIQKQKEQAKKKAPPAPRL